MSGIRVLILTLLIGAVVLLGTCTVGLMAWGGAEIESGGSGAGPATPVSAPASATD